MPWQLCLCFIAVQPPHKMESQKNVVYSPEIPFLILKKRMTIIFLTIIHNTLFEIVITIIHYSYCKRITIQ